MQVSFKSAHPQPPHNCVPEISDSIPTFKKIMHTRGTPAAIHHIFSRAGEEFFGAGRPTVPHISREKKMGGEILARRAGGGGLTSPAILWAGLVPYLPAQEEEEEEEEDMEKEKEEVSS